MMRHDLLATTNYTTATARMPDTIATVENISPQFPWRLGLGDYGVDFSTLRQSCSFLRRHSSSQASVVHSLRIGGVGMYIKMRRCLP
jgi:hypothetical protein